MENKANKCRLLLTRSQSSLHIYIVTLVVAPQPRLPLRCHSNNFHQLIIYQTVIHMVCLIDKQISAMKRINSDIFINTAQLRCRFRSYIRNK